MLCDPHRATPGYTLFSPINGKATYIIGLRGDVLHQWEHPLVNGTYAYLLDNGNLLWAGRLPEGPQHMGGRGGLPARIRLERQGTLGAQATSASITISAGCRTATPSSSAGRSCRPRSRSASPAGSPAPLHPDGCMYGDTIVEITPDGKTVWEWQAWRDMEVENYPLISNQLRDEFAHANAISPLPTVTSTSASAAST